MADKSYTVQVFGKAVEISICNSHADTADKAIAVRVVLYQARHTGTSKPVPPRKEVTGYGLTASEAVLDMLKAARICKGGTELL